MKRLLSIALLMMAVGLHAQTVINKPGINLGYLGNYDTGVIPDNIACMMNCGLEPLDFRTVSLQYINGTTKQAYYEPFYTNGAQPILPADHFKDYQYTLNRTTASSNTGCVAGVTGSSPYPGINSAVITAIAVASNVVTITINNSPAAPYTGGEYTAAMVLNLSGLAANYLNNVPFTATAATSTSLTLTAPGFSHADVATTSDAGFAEAELALNLGSTPAENGNPAVTMTCGSGTITALPSATQAADKYTLELVHEPTPAEWLNGQGNLTVKVNSGAPVLTGDTTTPLDGSGSLIVDTTASGSSVILSTTFDNGVFAGAGNNLNRFISLDGTYNNSIKAVCKSGSCGFTLGLYRGFGSPYCSSTFTSTSTAQTYTIPTCAPTENATNPTPQYAAQLEFTPTGAGVIEIDNFTLNKTSGKASANTSPFRDDVVAALQYATGYGDGKTIQPGVTPANQPAMWSTLRDWVNDERSYAGISATAFHALQNVTGSPGNEGPEYAPQLDDFLQLSSMIGAIPYWTIPCTFTNADGVALIRHLATYWIGPGKPFPYGYFPFCNEDWNGANQGNFIPSTRPGAYNGLSDYVDRFIGLGGAMAADPVYNAATMHFILNEQYGATDSFTDTNPLAPIPLLIAAHVPLWGIETAKYWQPGLSDFDTEFDQWQAGIAEGLIAGTNSPAWYPQPTAAIKGLVACGASNNEHCNITVYEQADSTGGPCGPVAPAPPCGGVHSQYFTQAVLQQSQRGAGTGIIAAAQAFNEMLAGYAATNLFGLSGYATNPIVGATPGSLYTDPLYNAIWGQTIDIGGATSYIDRALFGGYFTPSPSLIGIHVLNKTLLGPNNACATGLPTFNFVGGSIANSGIPSTSGLPLVQINCTADGLGNIGIFIANWDQTASHTVSIPSAYAMVGPVTAELFAPSSLNLLNEAVLPAQTNTTPAQVYTTTSTIVSPASYTLPPHSIVALKGTVAPVMSITHQTYGRPQKYGTVQPY